MDIAANSGIYYRHSGKYSLGGVLFALVIGLLVGLPCAWLYAWLDHVNPIVYVNLLASFGFGGAIGLAVSLTLQSRKCRNVAVSGTVALLVVLVSYYVSWAVWLGAVADVSAVALLQHPADLWQLLLIVNEKGAWSVRSGVVNGGALWVVWGAEAVCIIGTAVYVVIHSISEATYCEACDRYAPRAKSILSVIAGPNPSWQDKAAVKSYRRGLKAHAAELKQHLEVKDFAYVERLGAVQPGAVGWYDFELASCPQCNMTNTLTVTQFERKTPPNKAKQKITRRNVLRQLLLSASEADTVRQIQGKVSAAAQQALGTATKGTA